MKTTPSSPLISVIIPTYNEEKFLPRCLAALQKQQTQFPFEVLVIDHYSKDATVAIAKKFQAICIHEHTRGTAAARQTGIQKAKGAIVAFTEADCIVPSDWIETIGRHFTHHPTHVGIAGRYYFDDISSAAKIRMLFFMNLGNILFRLLYKTYPFRGTNSAAKKDILLQAGGFTEDKAPFDDADASQRTAKFGYIANNMHLVVATSSRRVKGRTFAYLKEFIYSYIRLYILGHKGNIAWYKVIR